MAESLERMGVDPKKMLIGHPNAYIQADELIVPSAVAQSCYTPEWVARYLRERLILTRDQNLVPTKRVFISRQKASYRCVANEDDVYALFQPLGFERYCLEELTFKDQVELFQQAKIVVSFHGAGLTNILFMQPESHVIELFQEHEDDSYCYLSQTLNLKYKAIKTCEFQKNGGYTTTTVPIDLIATELAALCKLQATS